jgi:hypothetical protein
MLMRDNKFDEFTLPDKISKTNMMHALANIANFPYITEKLFSYVSLRLEYKNLLQEKHIA